MEKKEKETKGNEEKKNNKRKILIIIIILIAIILAFLYWWFNRRFDVTFKYNNGLEDYKIQVKYLKYIDDKDVKKDLTASDKNFVGYYETYYLDGKQIEDIKNDANLESTICKDGFKLDSQKVKCIAKDEFDFPNTKIKKHTIIEALWSGISFTINPTEKTINEKDTFKITATVTGAKDKTVTWSSDNKNVATVDDTGKVTGVKAGTVNIYAESNGIRRKCVVTVKAVEKGAPAPEVDNGTISLSAGKTCFIGRDSVTVTANVKNAKDSTVNWTLPSCYTSEKVSNTEVKLSRKTDGCSATDETSFTITAKLNNGQSASASITYEPYLNVDIYDDSNFVMTIRNGDNEWASQDIYHPVIKSNAKASFSLSSGNTIKSKTDYSATLNSTGAADTTVTVSTACGQKASVKLNGIIN